MGNPTATTLKAKRQWEHEIASWALEYAERLSAGIGSLGVAIGGSIARGQHWEHSDLEILVLVDACDLAVAHFGGDSGRGVELFQLEMAQLEKDLQQVEAGNLAPVARWPPQFYQARVTHDPTGLLHRFAAQLDCYLFSESVCRLKLAAHQSGFEDALREAETLLEHKRPRAALAKARVAINERILMLHWTLGELPRSQNRVDSRLKALTEKHGLETFYQLFREVFDLDSAESAIRHDWPAARQQVLQLTELWEGKASREFFTIAVDSSFTWGENSSIICVYRIYVPLMGAPADGVLQTLDDPKWRHENRHLVRFLGFETANESLVRTLLRRLSTSDSPTTHGDCANERIVTGDVGGPK